MKKDDIRPLSIINEYIRLAKINTKVFFDNASREEIKYSTFGNKQEQSFNENGFKVAQEVEEVVNPIITEVSAVIGFVKK